MHLYVIAVLLLWSCSAQAADFCETWLTTEESISQAHTVAAELLAARSRGLSEELVYPSAEILSKLRARGVELHHAERWTIRGVPSTVTAVSHETTVFRHYAPVNVIREILASSKLQTGYLSYVEASPGLYKRVYSDLTGAFLTFPGVPRESVGVNAHQTEFGHVDFMISAEIPVLLIERDILLVPLAPRTPLWIGRYYLAQENGTLAAEYLRIHRAALDELAAHGGVNLTPAAIPIQIVSHSPLP